jgi:hypothetical protein
MQGPWYTTRVPSTSWTKENKEPDIYYGIMLAIFFNNY